MIAIISESSVVTSTLLPVDIWSKINECLVVVEKNACVSSKFNTVL